MTTNIEATKEAVREHLKPAFEAVEANVRDARRAVEDSRRAAEDFIDETTLQVRRHPLGSIALAAAAGALAGGVLGFALGWQAGRGRSDA